jgi:TamB, inner membrane protein subunit of TAM complex
MASSAPRPKRSVARRAALALGWTAAGGATLLLGASLYVQSPGFRSYVVSRVNTELAGSVRGRITLEGLTRLSLGAAHVHSVRVSDEHGESVLELEDVTLGFDLLGLLGPWLPSPRSGVKVEHVRVERSRVRLVRDESTGELTLVRALGKDSASAPGPEKPGPLTVALAAVELGEVDVDIDIDIDPDKASLGRHALRVHHVRGKATIDAENTEVEVQSFGVLMLEGGQRWIDGTGSLRIAQGGALSSDFHGFVRGLELDVGLGLDARVLALRLELPSAPPDRLRELWPAWPLRSSLAAHVTARGPLGALKLEGFVTHEGTRLDVTGSADVEGPPRAHLDVRAHGLDAQALDASAPRTDIDARAGVDLSQGRSGLLLVSEVTTEPTRVGALQLPSVRVSLRNEKGTTAAQFALGDARGKVAGEATIAPGGSVDVSARLTGLSLDGLPELRGRVAGRIDGRARAHFGDGRFQGSAEGLLRDLAASQLKVASGTWRASFDGSLAALSDAALEVSVSGDDVRVGPLRLARVVATGRGPWHTSRVQAELTGSDGARGTVSARLGLRKRVRLEDAELAWQARELSLSAHVTDWLPEAGTLQIDRVVLGGKVGALDGSLRVAPGRVEVAAHVERLDTERVARTFGLSGVGVRGVISGKVSLLSTPSEAHGELELDGEKVRVQSFSLGTLGARATLSERHVELSVDATDASLGRLEIRGSGELGGRPLELASWLHATGSGSLALNQLPLWPVGLFVGQKSRIKDLDGRLDLGLKLERQDEAGLPDLFLTASTDGLTFKLVSDVAGVGPRQFDRYGVHGSASIDGHGGQGTATLLVTDEHGSLVTTSGSLAIDLQGALRAPRQLLERLLQTPLDALVRLHPRPISQLPAPFGVRDLAGSVEATLALRGSLAEPRLSLAAQGHQLQGGVAEGNRAVDVSSVLEYTPKNGQLRGTAEVSQDGKSLVAARLEGRVPNPLEPGANLDAIELRAAAMLNGVPLELVPLAARERIQARLYGSVDVEMQRGQPSRQRAHLEIANLSAQGHPLGNGRLTFDNRADGLRAELRVGSRDHYLRANVRGPTATESDANIEGSLDAHDFDAASLSPLTSGLLSRLGGVLNADLDFSLKPTGSDWYLGINGKAVVANGNAHIEELGLEVREIAAELHARSTPEYSVLQIAPFSAKARSRTPNLKGDAELWLRGFRVVNGETNLTLDEVPLSLKGVSRGIAKGQVKARLERVEDYLSLEVKLPELRVRLPASTTRSLIALEPNADLHVLQAEEQLDEARSDALLWKIQLDLGKKLRIQRGDLDIPLTGHPVLDYQYELRPSGTIEALPGGRIRLFDQNFSIDRALVQLVPEEPDNPHVDVTASWRSADGTTVYVDVTGRANDPIVLTRDDRGLQEVERFYLITGGSLPEGRELAAGATADSGAIGQTFSLGINELLRNSLGNVAVSVGTTADYRASYSASVRLSDKLSFQGSFQPASESNLEESTNDLTGTLDYRFTRRWSLRTELGTSGGAFDLLWSHRY